MSSALPNVLRPLIQRLVGNDERLGSFDSEAPEGHRTLVEIERQAPNYNAWVARRIAAHAGQRVLEVGAGIGTITAHLLRDRQLVTALEVEPTYVGELKRRFSGIEHVKVLERDASKDLTDLAADHYDTIVMCNVLEHVPDDAAALKALRALTDRGAKLVVLVPALPALFGAIDEAVGHHRRYTPSLLTGVIERAGFEVTKLEWTNPLGIPGWLFNGRLLKRREMPPVQLAVFDRVAPLLAKVESHVRMPIGLSLLCVATAR